MNYLSLRQVADLLNVVPSLVLGRTPLNQVVNFKYLGHAVTENMKDDFDLEREHRELAVLGNMLARRSVYKGGEINTFKSIFPVNVLN